MSTKINIKVHIRMIETAEELMVNFPLGKKDLEILANSNVSVYYDFVQNYKITKLNISGPVVQNGELDPLNMDLTDVSLYDIAGFFALWNQLDYDSEYKLVEFMTVDQLTNYPINNIFDLMELLRNKSYLCWTYTDNVDMSDIAEEYLYEYYNINEELLPFFDFEDYGEYLAANYEYYETQSGVLFMSENNKNE